MTDNDLTDSATTQIDLLEVKIEPPKPNDSSPDFILLQMSPKSKIQDNRSMSNETNGNSLEKNGQKRIQTAPIDAPDGTSKKPRINTPEDSNVRTQKAGGDETDLNKKAGGDETDLNKKAGGDEPDLNKKAGGDETGLNKKAGGDETDLNKKAGGDETDLNKKAGGDETDLNKKAGGDETGLNKRAGGDETDLNKKPGEDETGLNKKAGGDETGLNKKAGGDGLGLNKKADGNKIDNQKGGVEEMDQSTDTEEYYLIVQNLPHDWTYVQIKNYLDKECGHVDELEMLKHRKAKNCAIRLTFQSIEKCTVVFKKLENKFIQDKKLKVKICDTYTTFPTSATVPSSIQDNKKNTFSNEVLAATRWRPDLDSLDIDPEGLYGLRLEFLNSLGIKPPLNKTVHVTNFRCDKNELKEVMEMAGHVLMCCVVASITKYAKVMYSHPLEAVQSISMLNGQLYYGTPLKIAMDKNSADSVVLPKGLAGIGQGLGIKARPIRNIVQQYHRFANKQTSSINPTIFTEIDFSDDYMNKTKTEENAEEIEKNIHEFLKSRPGCNIINPTVQLKTQNIDEMECPDSLYASSSTFESLFASKSKRGGKKKGVGSPQDLTKIGFDKQQNNSPQLAALPNPLVRLGNPKGPGNIHPSLMLNPPVPVHMSGPREPFFRPSNQHEPRPFRPRVPFIPPPMQRPPFPQPRPPFCPPTSMRPPIPPNFNGPPANAGNRVTVTFSNLPPSTTFPFLCDLLAQCGQVMSVQLTTPGCAVATFGHPSHAERCFQNFNGMNMEGFLIEVGFV